MAQTQIAGPGPEADRLDVTVRAGGPHDAPALAAMLRGLSPESAFRRFLVGLGEPKPGFVRQLLGHGPRRGALLATLPDGLVVGHACWSVDAADVGDVGVVVTDAWQRRGVGTSLVQGAVARIAAAGARSLHLDVHPENRGVVRTVRNRLPGATARFADGLVQFDTPLAALVPPVRG